MKRYLNYIITLLIGLIFAFLICVFKNIFTQTSVNEVMHILVDAFFAPGVVLMCFGLLIVSTNGGTFDMLGYGVIMFISLFNKGTERKYKTFYDYRESKKEKKRSFGYLLVVGVFLTIISLIFLIFWYKTK